MRALAKEVKPELETALETAMKRLGKADNADEAASDEAKREKIDAEAQSIAGDLPMRALDALTEIDELLTGAAARSGRTEFKAVAKKIRQQSAASDARASAAASAKEEASAFDGINHRSAAWANERAAELVTDITEATRDRVRSVIADGIAEGETRDRIVENVMASSAFDEKRAALIADMEIRRAHSEGALEGYRQSKALGIDIKKAWLLAADPCPICEENAIAGAIGLEEEFPGGVMAAPQHTRCRCAITPVIRF